MQMSMKFRVVLEHSIIHIKRVVEVEADSSINAITQAKKRLHGLGFDIVASISVAKFN